MPEGQLVLPNPGLGPTNEVSQGWKPTWRTGESGRNANLDAIIPDVLDGTASHAAAFRIIEQQGPGHLDPGLE